MLYTEEAAKANVRNRDGKRVFFLGHGDQLTSGARDYLTRERIEIRPADEAKIDSFRLLCGGTLTEKPEHMTHLSGDILVPKTHPRIRFRGEMDTLEAELLLCRLVCPEELGQQVDEILSAARGLIRCDVLDEPVPEGRLCGLTESEIRERSHLPQKYYAQAHFMPAASDGEVILRLNRARTAVRAAELAAAEAFADREGLPTRPDILRALNRMSSMLWILMILAKKQTL